MALKILHTADWHLGLTHPSFDEESERKLTRARLDVVDRILGEAESFGVDAVLCAGDLFDTHAPAQEWWRGLLGKLERLDWSGRRQLILLPGNHDPLNGPSSVYHPEHPFRRGLPRWARVVDQDNQEIALGDDAVLYATPCRAAAGAPEPVSRLPARASGDQRIRIGMLHGQASGYAGHAPNFPIDAAAAAERGLDYLALGDHHECRVVQEQPPVVYPGPPEPARMGEVGGQVMLAMFRRGGGAPVLRKIQVGRWRWVDTTCTTLAHVLELAEVPDLLTTVLRIKLDMVATVDELDEIAQLLDRLRGTSAAHGLAGVLAVDRSGLRQAAPTPELAARLPEPLRKVLQQLQAAELTDAVRQRAIHHLFQLHKQGEA